MIMAIEAEVEIGRSTVPMDRILRTRLRLSLLRLQRRRLRRISGRLIAWLVFWKVYERSRRSSTALLLVLMLVQIRVPTLWTLLWLILPRLRRRKMGRMQVDSWQTMIKPCLPIRLRRKRSWPLLLLLLALTHARMAVCLLLMTENGQAVKMARSWSNPSR